MLDKNRHTPELPEKLKRYFWDVDPGELSFEENSRFIAERILNLGNPEDVKWLFSRIDIQYIRTLVKNSRNLNNKTRNFWQTMLR